MLIASGFFGFVSDLISKNKSETFSRKAVSTTSSCGIALSLVLLSRNPCMLVVNIALSMILAFSVGIGKIRIFIIFKRGVLGSFLALEPNSMDLAPDHAGIIQGLVNTVGNCAGFGRDKIIIFVKIDFRIA